MQPSQAEHTKVMLNKLHDYSIHDSCYLCPVSPMNNKTETAIIYLFSLKKRIIAVILGLPVLSSKHKAM